MRTTIERIERTTVEVPLRDIPARNLQRQMSDWNYFEVVEVELDDGTVGYGETMLYYTWEAPEDEDVERAMGENAVSLLWDDSLGAGLQMALFDAVGRSAGVPIHNLLGKKVADRTPLSWWATDMSADDWVAEAETALDHGYESIKLKGRPWFDLRAQIERLCEALPEWFRINIDFNESLVDSERAISLLQELEAFPQVDKFESPISEDDIDGYVAIQEAVNEDISVHYGTSTQDPTPPPRGMLARDACDGLVVSGNPSQVRDQIAVAAMADKPFWLQLVGTGITAAFSLHFGGVASHARWPAINCHQLFKHPLIMEPIEVEDGHASVPDSPGLGYDVDTEAIEQFRVEETTPRDAVSRLIRATWPDGRTMYFASGKQMQSAAQRGEIPFYERGVSAQLVPDDDSSEWERLQERAGREPVLVPPDSEDPLASG